MIPVRLLFLLVAAGLAMAQPGSAAGRTCPAIQGSSDALAELPAAERLAFLRARLAREKARAWDWSTGWKVTYGLLIGGQLALVTVLPKKEHPDLFLGAASSAIGLGSILVSPRPVLTDQPALEQQMVLEGERAVGCELLAQAEAMALRDAEAAAFSRGWFTHTGNALLAIGFGLIMWQGLDDWQGGLTALITNFAVGEVMIWTHPAGLEDDLDRYRRGALDLTSQSPSVDWGLSPLVVRRGGGLLWAARF